jgi:Mg-chelatase subunit ChlD
VPLENVPELTSDTYLPGGGTALFDAISESVRVAEKDKSEDERVICVIMTDGEENSSRETTKEQVKEIISGYEAKGDWTFLYIGENPERWTRDAGMSSGHGVSYNHIAPRANYLRANEAVQRFRQQSARQAHNLFDSN